MLSGILNWRQRLGIQTTRHLGWQASACSLQPHLRSSRRDAQSNRTSRIKTTEVMRKASDNTGVSHGMVSALSRDSFTASLPRLAAVQTR